MFIDAFDFMWRSIRFSDNSKINHKVVCGYDPLFKVSYPLEIMTKRITGVWTAINHVTIDESMIKYIDRDVKYFQYMPKNTIKHVIKMFAICSSLSTILLYLKVYVGQEDDSDSTALGFFDRLVKEAGITNARGRTLYTNNYCTLMAIDKHIFNKYGWTIVGTIIPTEKKSRADHHIPLLKL